MASPAAHYHASNSNNSGMAADYSYSIAQPQYAPSPNQQQQQQHPFAEEDVAIQTVKESLEEAWCYFHSGKLPVNSDPSLPAPTVEQTHELLDVYYQLLQTVMMEGAADGNGEGGNSTASTTAQRAFVVETSIRIRPERTIVSVPIFEGLDAASSASPAAAPTTSSSSQRPYDHNNNTNSVSAQHNQHAHNNTNASSATKSGGGNMPYSAATMMTMGGGGGGGATAAAAPNGRNYNYRQEERILPVGVLPVLANFAIHTMSYAPEILDNGGSLQEAFSGLRCHALRCLKGIVLLAAATEEAANAQLQLEQQQQQQVGGGSSPSHYLGGGGGGATPTASSAPIAGLGCASKCTAALIELSLPEDLLVSVLPATGLHEAVRVAACEVIFAFAFRLPSACESLLVCQAVPRLLLRLRAEPSPTVKVFMCSILRLLVTELPEEAIGDGNVGGIGGGAMDPSSSSSSSSVVSAFVDILLSDNELDDIRVMATEILCAACKTRVGAQQLLTTDNSLVSDLLMLVQFTIANSAAAPTVVEALCRLVECMTIAASTLRVVPFFELVTAMEIEKPLSQNLRRPRSEINIVAAAARALRHLIQWAPPAYSLTSAIVTNFPTLSVILKTLLECDRENGGGGADVSGTPNGNGASAPSSSEDADLHQQIVSVELAITIALMMAQSPFARAHINSELCQYPSWSQSLLDAVTKFLNAPTLDYYASIDIVDVTGTCINTLTAVGWSEGGKPLKSTIRKLFDEQTERVERMQLNGGIGVGGVGGSYNPAAALSAAAGTAGAHGNNHQTSRHGAATNNNSTMLGFGGNKQQLSLDEVKARAKLTFVLLNFAMALALDGGASSAAPTADAINNGGSYTTPSRTGRGGINNTTVLNSPGTSHIINATTPRGAAGRGRNFPSMGPSSLRANTTVGPNGSTMAMRPPLSRAEKEQMLYAYDKFDSAFKLVLRFAKYYERKEQQEAASYVHTADGYMVRQTQLKNPWAKIVKRKRALSWSVADVKEGDMFYFAVPYEELTLKAVETLMMMLKRHMAGVKKNLVITPHTAKGRRSLLYDLQENVLPSTMSLLIRLAELLDSRGESTVRFPIFLFREREIHVGERALHAGILPSVMDQVEYYFTQTADEQAAMQTRPDLTAEIDAKIAELKARTFTGNEDAVDMIDSDDDERVPGRGHGGISSDSD